MEHLKIEVISNDQIEQCRQLCDELMAYQKSMATIAPEAFDGMNFDTRLKSSYMNSPVNQLAVAKDGDVPVGYVFSTIESVTDGDKSTIPDWAPRDGINEVKGFYPDWVDTNKKVGCLNHLYFRKEYRSMGLGTKLLDMALEWIESFSDVDLTFVYISNGNDAALDFYLRHGFIFSHDVFGGFIKAAYRRKPVRRVYNPGCALLIYKPDYADKILRILNKEYGNIDLHTVCCRHNPQLEGNVEIINTCAGCDNRFSNLYEGVTTVSLWEIISNSMDFPFPDYNGLKMTVHDACPVRSKSQVHEAIRGLLKKMNIEIVEAKNNRSGSVCCGDNFYPSLSVEQVHEQMKKRADEMPCEDVCVYCVSCIKAMYIGGKKPRYILDLLFNEPTDAQTFDTVEWHNELQKFIDAH